MVNDLLEQLQVILTGKQKRQAAVLFAVMLVGAFLEAFGVSVIVPFVAVITRDDFIHKIPLLSRIFDSFGFSSPYQFAFACIAAMIFIYLAKTAFLIFEYGLQAEFISRCKFETQRRLVQSFLNRPYVYYLRKNSADMHKLLVSDLNKVFQVLQNLLAMLTDIIVAVVLLITLFIIDPLMSASVLFIILLTVFIISRFIRPRLDAAGKVVVTNERIRSRWINQGFAGIKEIKHIHAEEFVAGKICETGRQIAAGERVRQVLGSIPRALIEMACVCGMLGVLVMMMSFGKTLESLLPAVSAFAMVAIKVMPAANRITSTMATVVYNMPVLKNLASPLRESEGQTEKTAHTGKRCTVEKKTGEERYDIIFDHVSFAYPGTDRLILEDVSFKAERGKMIGISGVSGAGKTTFADIMLGILEPDSGQVLIQGSSIGYIPQFTFMLDDTVRANVAFGIEPGKIEDERVWECLAEAQIADYFKSVPEGLDTKVGERGIRLSGGQVQRIGIARALYRQPDILVFDEATSALDLETEAAIIDAVNQMHGKKTMVIIAHKSGVLADCDEIYKVADGKLILARQRSNA